MASTLVWLAGYMSAWLLDCCRVGLLHFCFVGWMSCYLVTVSNQGLIDFMESNVLSDLQLVHLFFVTPRGCWLVIDCISLIFLCLLSNHLFTLIHIHSYWNKQSFWSAHFYWRENEDCIFLCWLQVMVVKLRAPPIDRWPKDWLQVYRRCKKEVCLGEGSADSAGTLSKVTHF